MSSEKIAKLNDEFRANIMGNALLKNVVMTSGVSEAAKNNPTLMPTLLMAIQTFNNFNVNNDPYGERDFGTIVINGEKEKFFWKIDYYDKAKEYGSEDPADPKITTRIMTIMFASEY